MYRLIITNKDNEIILDKDYEREVILYPSNMRTNNTLVKVTDYMNVTLTEAEIVQFYSKFGEIDDNLAIKANGDIKTIPSKNVVIVNDQNSKNYIIEIREEIQNVL